MVRLPTLKAEQLLAAMKKAGFKPTRQRGSHMRLRHKDGRVITIPIHRGQDVGRGLLRKILRDAEFSREEFLALL